MFIQWVFPRYSSSMVNMYNARSLILQKNRGFCYGRFANLVFIATALCAKPEMRKCMGPATYYLWHLKIDKGQKHHNFQSYYYFLTVLTSSSHMNTWACQYTIHFCHIYLNVQWNSPNARNIIRLRLQMDWLHMNNRKISKWIKRCSCACGLIGF